MLSLDDCKTEKASGQWPITAPVAIPFQNAGVICPMCGKELQSNLTPIDKDNPPHYRLECIDCNEVFTI